MLKFFKRNKNKDTTKNEINQNTKVNEITTLATETENAKHSEPLAPKEQVTEVNKNFFHRLYTGLTKTRKQIFGGITSLFTGKVTIDDELWEELENHLLLADVGIDVTKEILEELTKEIKLKESNDIARLKTVLKNKLLEILTPCQQSLEIKPTKPFVILMVGVNGAGKTTTIGKLAHQFQKQGHSVMLAAGDTFRAAAVEQLIVWGERNNIPVVAQKTGADSASVIFDAYQSAKAKNIDILIADTAGRLHTQSNLMQELAKIKRVLNKQDADAPHETMLVLDSCMGQNALQQAKQFQDIVDLSGITITKLDGTAKGGVIFAIAKKLKLPIRYIGVGESIDDLQTFSANDFITALIE
jgi:fused signal recognition particle receptor